MKIFNSLTKQEEEFQPIKKGKVTMYTCGPTVYNYAHIGNFFAYLSADTLYRWLIFGEGYEVKWVMNITDIDDKTIRDSKEKYPQEEPMKALNQFCQFYEKAFKDDLKILNITGISEFPRATEFIAEQQELVRSLYKNGFAYIADGSVYFDIQAYKKAGNEYGRLVHIDEGFQAGARVNQDEYEKESASDFVLWKGYKDGEPFWEFELDGQNLKGRPGWHLECSAMEKEILGLPFDIHTGGADLKFPHHEDEIAQSCGGYCIDPTRVFVHNGHLLVEGEKMSKSKGNFFQLGDLVKQGWEPDVIRLAVVTNHYRGDFNFTQNGLHAAKKNLNSVRILYERIEKITPLESKYLEDRERLIPLFDFQESERNFWLEMKDDLNTPSAYSSFLLFVREVEDLPRFGISAEEKKNILEFLDLASNVFGVDFKPQIVEIPDEVKKLVEAQKQAKEAKNFAEADRIRDELKAKGFAWDARKNEIVKI